MLLIYVLIALIVSASFMLWITEEDDSPEVITVSLLMSFFIGLSWPLAVTITTIYTVYTTVVYIKGKYDVRN
jgi:hypothetical protein